MIIYGLEKKRIIKGEYTESGKDVPLKPIIKDWDTDKTKVLARLERLKKEALSPEANKGLFNEDYSFVEKDISVFQIEGDVKRRNNGLPDRDYEYESWVEVGGKKVEDYLWWYVGKRVKITIEELGEASEPPSK